jgi:choline-sulfatase
MSDEHAWWAAGAFGHPFVRTPNIDRLAAAGVTFDRAYCNSPVCAPSRASFLTGRLPTRLGVFNNNLPFASDVPTWAHYLSAAGYQTVLSGKQHFAGPDQRHGFELRLGEEPQSTRIKPHSYTDTRPGQRYFAARPASNEYVEHDKARVDEAVHFLARGRDTSRPFALCVSLYAPHFPFEVEREYWDLYWPRHADLPPPLPDGFLDRLHAANHSLREFYEIPSLTEDQVRRARAAYYGQCTFMDAQLGRLLDALDHLGLERDTLVVYTSDHGEMLGDHGLWLKQNFFESSVRVPLLVSWPGVLPDRERRGCVVSLVDLAAALVEWGGGRRAAGMDGVSLAGLAADAGAPWVDLAVSEIVDINQRVIMSHYPEAGAPKRMLVTERFKLIAHGVFAPELYDLALDPEEWRDVSADPRYAPVLGALRRRLLADWRPQAVEAGVLDAVARARVIMEAETTYLGPPATVMGGR